MTQRIITGFYFKSREKLYRELGQTYFEYYSLDKEQPNENESELAKDSEPAAGNQKVG